MHPFLPSAQHPVTLIGFSWGAWLSFILAARYPALVKSLVLIGSGPFEEKYAARIVQTRLSRLSEEEGRQAVRIFAVLDGQNNGDREKDRLLASMGELFSRTDSFDPIEWELDPIMPCHADIYQSVWKEA
ncbi:MAG: alpha/beta hydrolase [Methanothrix sp.]|nr:alpha/beta hydrolase [Methanothrix sp.]